MDGQMNRPKPISPFNFFEVRGITMHQYTSYHLTFKYDLDLQPTNIRFFVTKNQNLIFFFFLGGGGGGKG